MLDKAKNEEDKLCEILSLVTHDLKSPLTAVMGSVELLAMDDITKQEKQECLKIAKKGTKSVLKLIENILTMAKIEAGKSDVTFESVTKVEKYFQEIYDTFKFQTKIKNIDFKLEIKDDLPIVYWDIDKIHYHVINNIISNSIKFTPNGGKIYFKVYTQDQNIIITIKDNGVGIGKKDQKEIFSKYKTHNNQKKYKGKGLGLFNAHHFVKEHGGDIELIDGLDKKGVGFKITLPTSM